MALCATTFFASKQKPQTNYICVAYSADNNYIYPTLVSMTSVMENANSNTFCKFTVLIADNVSNEGKEEILTVLKKYPNCSVNLVDMGEQFSNSDTGSWTKAMYYRLNLPEILKDEKRCLYLDGDTIVRHDIYDMFKINMNNHYIAGIRDTNVYISPESTYYKELKIPNINSYVCSGVLLMNLEKMRNDNIHSVLDNLITENDKTKTFKFPDQDALNIACYGHILSLPFKYGALAHAGLNQSYSENDYAQWASNEKDWDEGRKDPTIVHFTGTKPWIEKYSDLCNEWWGYAKKSECSTKISEKYKI